MNGSNPVSHEMPDEFEKLLSKITDPMLRDALRQARWSTTAQATTDVFSATPPDRTRRVAGPVLVGLHEAARAGGAGI